VLGQHPPHPAERTFFGVGQVANDLDDGPLPRPRPMSLPGSSIPATSARNTIGVARRVFVISIRRSSMRALLK
jgi:hypothetical protein